MNAAILSIGTELTRGELVNTNAPWIAARLTELGAAVTAIDTVADDPEAIREALRRLGAGCDLLVCTGGLGPTTDDLTTRCVADVLGVPLERDPASLAAIRRRMERFGRVMAESNAKQADFPRGARILPNAEGTAPGFAVSLGRAEAFFLPGVPREMKALFEAFIAPGVRPLGEHRSQIRIHTFGLPESTVNDRLAGVEAEHRVTLGYRAHFPEIEVKALAVDPTPEGAAARARRAADAIRRRLGDPAYGEGDVTLAETVGRLLVERRLTLAAAESCTGGLLSELLTDRPGSSAYFLGAVVSYANSAKVSLLGVDPQLLEAHGAVSAEVARAMARGARRALGADVAASITGVAGPGGGTEEKPVGLVHLAVATPGGVTDERLLYPASRAGIRRIAAFRALDLIRRVLLHGHPAPAAS